MKTSKILKINGIIWSEFTIVILILNLSLHYSADIYNSELLYAVMCAAGRFFYAAHNRSILSLLAFN